MPETGERGHFRAGIGGEWGLAQQASAHMCLRQCSTSSRQHTIVPLHEQQAAGASRQYFRSTPYLAVRCLTLLQDSLSDAVYCCFLGHLSNLAAWSSRTMTGASLEQESLEQESLGQESLEQEWLE